MALRVAPLALAFGGGIDSRTDSKQVPTTKLLDLKNAVITHQFTISKRTGYRALSNQIQDGAGTITAGRGLAERDGEVLLFTDRNCLSYRPSTDCWSDTGEVAASTASTLPIARTGSYQTQPDHAVRNGIRVAAWEDSRGGVWCSVFEAGTDRVLRSQTQLDASANAKNPSCVAVGQVLLVIWTREDLGFIYVATVNPFAPALAPAVTILTTDLDASKPFYDVMEAVDAPAGFAVRPAVIAWALSGGGFRVGYIAPSAVLGSAITGLPGVASFAADLLTGPIAVAWDSPGKVIGVAWCSGGNSVKARFLAGALPSTVNRTTGALGSGTSAYTRITAGFGRVGSDNASTMWWTAEDSSLARSDLTFIDSGAVLQTVATLDATSTRLRGHGLVSRAWHDGATLLPGATQDGDVYACIAHTTRFFPYVAALRLSSAAGIAAPSAMIVARLMPGESAGSLMRPTAPGVRAWTQHLPSVTQEDLVETNVYSRSHAVCVPYRIQLSSRDGDQFSEQGLKLATLGMQPAYLTAQLGRNLYLASAAPMSYDGNAWHEADFHAAPDFGYSTAGAPVDLATAVSIGAAGAIPNGTYVYAFWYETVDDQGELHRGAVSAKITVTMAGGPKKFSIALPTCRLTRFSNVRICVARSEQGATGTDESIPLYKVTNNDATITTGDNRYVNNDPTVDAVTFVDNVTDLALLALEPLYTNGGVLSNSPSPWGGKMIASGKGRLFWDDATDPNMLRYSQQRDDDTALEAPVNLSLRKDPFGGGLTAIGVMDDTVIPFAETAIFVFGGPGPLANPTVAPETNAFTPIELVTTDVGCVSPASIGATPLGLTFKSHKGIMLLARSRQVLDIGNDVQGYDAQNVVRATLIPNSQRIVFLTDVGRTLMWDYNRNAWATWTNHEGLDAIVLDNLYYYLRTDSRVYVETPGLYRDDQVNIRLGIRTAWIHFAEHLQGWQRILYAYFLGRFISRHTLVIRYGLNYDEALSGEITSDVNSNFSPSLYGTGLYGAGSYGGPGGGASRYQRRIHINKRCQSISFLIEDLEAAGDAGASFELSELCLIGGGLGADFKIGAARSA